MLFPVNKTVFFTDQICSKCGAMLLMDYEYIRYCTNPVCGYWWYWDIKIGEVEINRRKHGTQN